MRRRIASAGRARARRGEAGQALTEAAIVLPIMVFVVLGALQIMMLEHGRIMTEYAAYNATRAGIVHNANWNVMRNAAMVSVLPLYDRTDTFGHFMWTWARVKAVAEITEQVDTGVGTLERLGGDLLGAEISGIAPDISLIEVNVTSPDRQAFRDAQTWQQQQEQQALQIDPQGRLEYPEQGREIDFDDVEFLQNHPDAARLGVEVRVLCPLRIPIVNKIIFQLWLAQQLLNTRQVRSNITEWAELRGRVEGGRNSGQYLDEAVKEADGDGPLDDFFTTRQWTKEIKALRYVAEHYDIYIIPLFATYAMQMQSNMFENNRREPVWFTID